MNKPKFTIPLKLSLIDACLQGLATTDNFEDYADHWHMHPEAGGELREFLGLTEFEYEELLLHNNCFLDEVLYCRRNGKDLQAVWTPEKKDDLNFLLMETQRLKKWLRNQIDLSDEDVSALLSKLGSVIYRKNQLTGWDQDIRYLYNLEEEVIQGFPGDSSGTVDADGNTLLIGDVVNYSGEDGKQWKRMVLQCANGAPALEQDWLLRHNAQRVNSYSEAMKMSLAFTGIRMEMRSCRTDFILQQRKEQAATRGLAELLCFPVYWDAPQTAWDRGELKLYQASVNANERCAAYINDGTHESMYYPLRKTLAQELVRTFGMERSLYVAASVLTMEDGRIAREVRHWADRFMADKSPMRWHCTTNPGVMSMLGKDLMKLEQRANQAITEVLASIALATLTDAQRDLLRNSAWNNELLQQKTEELVQQEQTGPAQGIQTLG